MPGPEESLHVLDGILGWLPLVLALSANSPYSGGDETGMASYRAEILGILPRAWRAAQSRLLRRVGGADGQARRDRSRLGLHGDLVGRARPSEVRDARDPQPRPADLGRAHGGLRRALSGALRARAGRAATRTGLRIPRRLRPEPLGRVPLRPPRDLHPSRRRARRGGARARGASCSTASAHMRASSGRRSCSRSSLSTAARATACSRSAGRRASRPPAGTWWSGP